MLKIPLGFDHRPPTTDHTNLIGYQISITFQTLEIQNEKCNLELFSRSLSERKWWTVDGETFGVQSCTFFHSFAFIRF